MKRVNGTLSREAILSAEDLPSESIEIPEWGGSVTVRAMRAADFLEYASASRETVIQGVLALVAATVVDDAGQRMFTMEDVAALSQKSMTALNRVFTAATRINAAAIGAKVEDAEKN